MPCVPSTAATAALLNRVAGQGATTSWIGRAVLAELGTSPVEASSVDLALTRSVAVRLSVHEADKAAEDKALEADAVPADASATPASGPPSTAAAATSPPTSRRSTTTTPSPNRSATAPPR